MSSSFEERNENLLELTKVFADAIKHSKPLEEVRNAAEELVEKTDQLYDLAKKEGLNIKTFSSYKTLLQTYPYEYDPIFETKLTELVGFKFENLYSAAEFVMIADTDTDD
jgi:exoribonuclease R